MIGKESIYENIGMDGKPYHTEAALDAANAEWKMRHCLENRLPTCTPPIIQRDAVNKFNEAAYTALPTLKNIK